MAMNQESLWKAAVTAIAARRSSIFSWNTGFASERAGSPMIITTPVARRIGSVHQIAGRKRFVTRASGWSRPTIPSSRRSSISSEDIAAAIARIWIVCTVGTTHPALWIAWLSGVCSSQEQNLSRAWVRIQLGRIPVMACSAGIVDLSSGGKYPRGISRPGGLERFLRSFSQAARRGAPLVLIPGAGLHHEQVRRFDEHRGAVAHGIPLLLRLRSDFLRALLGDDGLDRIPDGVRGRIDHPLHQLLQAQHGPHRARRRGSRLRRFAATELQRCGEQDQPARAAESLAASLQSDVSLDQGVTLPEETPWPPAPCLSGSCSGWRSPSSWTQPCISCGSWPYCSCPIPARCPRRSRPHRVSPCFCSSQRCSCGSWSTGCRFSKAATSAIRSRLPP